MARRRSLNRRWSRRSINATELDQDSEFFDEDNPVWWKNLPDSTTTIRPSAHTSLAETTVPNLTADSLVNDSELHDRWWDNLDRTSLQSSRRFSTRKSVNPEEVAPESFISEGDEDVSIKKRKVLLQARAKRSLGTNHFLKAFDDSDVAHSEPVPSKKRKTQSPARSEADLIAKKNRTRHSRSLAERQDSSFNTSNDTDIVVKARPKAFEKRATKISSDVYDDILSTAGPSGINISRNASTIGTPEKSIDSNESGFMGPPITGSHRKRLSTISKKLDMTSDESEGYAGTVKSRSDFRAKSKRKSSFNPFDEILSGQLNESTGSGNAANKSGRSSNAATRMSKSLRENKSLHVSMRENEEGEGKESSASESQLRERDSTLKDASRVSKSRKSNEEHENEATKEEWNVPETQEIPDELKKTSTMIDESVIDENSPESQNIDRRSTSLMTENSRHSKRRTRDATSEFIVPETQEDANSSTNRIKITTMIEESVEIDMESQERDPRSSVLKKHSGNSRRHTKDATNEWNIPETQEDSRKSTKNTNNSIIIGDSVEIDNLPESQDRRSASVLKKLSVPSKRRTGDATIEITGRSEWEVQEIQEDSRKSSRRIEKSIIEESMDINKLSQSQRFDRKSSSVLKRNSSISQGNIRNAIIEEDPGISGDSRILINPDKNSTITGESIEADILSVSQEINRRSKSNSRISKRLTRNATIEDVPTGEWELPEILEDSRTSIRPVKNSTMIEELNEADKLLKIHDRSRRSSSVPRKSLRDSKRRTRQATIDEATIEADELPTFEEKTAKFTSTLIQNVRDPKRRTDSMDPIIQTTEHEKLAAKSRSQLFENWESSDSEEEEKANKSHNVSHNSSPITKTAAVSINRLSPTKSLRGRNSNEFKDTREETEKERKSHVERRSLRSRSRNLIDSAYELPDKERSASPIISENDSINKSSLLDRSKGKSPKNQQPNKGSARKSVNRSISDISRRSRADPNVSRSRLDFVANLGESDIKIGPENRTKSRKDLFAENKPMSTQEIGNASVLQQEDSDQSISEELVIGSQRSSSDLSRKMSRIDRKTNESRQHGEEEEALRSRKSNSASPRKSSRLEKQMETTKNAISTISSQENPNFGESISDAETEIAENEPPEENLKSLRAEKRSNKSRKSSTQPNVSGKREESGESISEEEFNSKTLKQTSKDKINTSRKNSGRVNVSRQRIESDESISEEDSNVKSLNQSPKETIIEDRKSIRQQNVSKRHSKFHISDAEENAENVENPNLDTSANGDNRIDELRPVENIGEDASTSGPSESIPLAPVLSKLPQNTSSILNKSKKPRGQKNITEFFPSKFLQKGNNSKLLENSSAFDKEKFDLVRKEIEKQRQERIDELSKKKEIPSARRPENPTKTTKLRAKENAPKKEAKPPKVVDKAYIVNGQVYKRPKLPRPKPWVTDRLYRHLWKRLEPKYDMRTRIKSEHFVVQLSEVVALTIRRKKYDSYKAEVDALMKEMARLDIIKTRNDFYDFCYDFLPYDFRVKVTPMILPGNIRNIPYDPAKLHTPIISES